MQDSLDGLVDDNEGGSPGDRIPLIILSHRIRLLRYFKQHPYPIIFLAEQPIPRIDTKLIEIGLRYGAILDPRYTRNPWPFNVIHEDSQVGYFYVDARQGKEDALKKATDLGRALLSSGLVTRLKIVNYGDSN